MKINSGPRRNTDQINPNIIQQQTTESSNSSKDSLSRSSKQKRAKPSDLANPALSVIASDNHSNEVASSDKNLSQKSLKIKDTESELTVKSSIQNDDKHHDSSDSNEIG